MEIRSFRGVFELERRVYRVDTVRLNPAGIPLRGILYAAGLVPAFLVFGRLPPTAWVLGLVPWYVRYLGLPCIAAALATILKIDGRPFHHAARALALHCVAPRRLSGLSRAASPGARWRPPPVVLIPDGSDAGFRRLRYRGPGAVMIGYPHDRAEWTRRPLVPGRGAADLTVRDRPGGRPLSRPVGLELADQVVLEVRPAAGDPPGRPESGRGAARQGRSGQPVAARANRGNAATPRADRGKAVAVRANRGNAAMPRG
jgi:hypothetical protein